jgi:DNA-3-methyladenine glycosylase I
MDLKKQGWKFVGPTTVYAFMQAMGLVNDHAEDCVIRPKVERARNGLSATGTLKSALASSGGTCRPLI